MEKHELKHDGGVALDKLRRHAQLAPQDSDIRFLLATELARLEHCEDAIDELRAVIRLAPNHLQARKLLDLLAGTPR